VADDSEDSRARRSRRRRRTDPATEPDRSSAAQIEPPQSVEPGPTPAAVGDTPLPTFLHAGPGSDATLDTFSGADRRSATVTSRRAADRSLDGSPVDRPIAAEPPRPSSVAQDWLPQLEDRSQNPEICPFLRVLDETGRRVAPVEGPDPANRCAALREAVPQSLRQQELVCLSSGHVNCPRYLRGALVIAEAPDPVVRTGRTLTPAILGSLVVLVMAASASVAFVMARGGLELAAAIPTSPPVASATAVAVAPVTAVPTADPTAIPTPVPTASPSPSPSPTPSPTPTPTPTLSPSPTPPPTAKPTTQPTTGTASRYAVLRACPDAPSCWIYRVRAGDNLYSIAHWFGVSIDSIYARNPWTRTQGLRAGQELRLPPPTR
jgi:LysM domain-containing protein